MSSNASRSKAVVFSDVVVFSTQSHWARPGGGVFVFEENVYSMLADMNMEIRNSPAK